MNKFIALWLLFAASSSALAAPPQAVTGNGLVEGREKNGLAIYKGIPYAAAPVGELRFREAKPALSWSGVKKAMEYGAPCLQTENFDADGRVIGSEDCLTLNVWQPLGSREPLPVMVFIHGGAFSWGSGRDQLKGVDLYDGSFLAAQGPAVVVNFNYRLGAFGFLAHPALREAGRSGNYGHSDQIEALRWVQQNIAAFGGDPARVMIFGESAGGFSVLNLLVSPAARGLFSRALLQSGSDIRYNASQAEEIGEKFASGLKCDTAACLRSLSAARIMAQTSNTLRGLGAKLVFSPHVDGTLIPEFPIAALRAGRYEQVPMVLGSNSDEMTVLGIPILKQKPIFLRKDYEELVMQEFGNELGPKVIEHYGQPLLRSSFQLLQEVFADNVFHCPAQEIAGAVSARQPGQVWKYLFTHSYYLDPLRILGAGHGLELPYVFHNFAPWYAPLRAPSEGEKALSREIVGFWTRFAATGNPNGKSGTGRWEAYRPEEGNYLELEIPLSRKAGYRAEQCAFWSKAAR